MAFPVKGLAHDVGSEPFPLIPGAVLAWIELLVDVCQKTKEDKRNMQILESALAAMVTLTLDHKVNSKKVIAIGIDLLLDFAESLASNNGPEPHPGE